MSEMTRKGSEKWVKHITLFQDAIANQLCPSCESGLDETMHRELDRLDAELWPAKTRLSLLPSRADLVSRGTGSLTRKHTALKSLAGAAAQTAKTAIAQGCGVRGRASMRSLPHTYIYSKLLFFFLKSVFAFLRFCVFSGYCGYCGYRGRFFPRWLIKRHSLPQFAQTAPR